MKTIFGALLACSLAASAHAQQVDPHAAELYEEGARAYREGRFDESAILIRRAYEIEPHPILLYNIARALESAGDLQGALEAYQQFLVDAPADAEQRPRVARRVEVLRIELDRSGTTSEPATEPIESDPPPAPAVDREGPAAWPWIIAGVGVVTAAVGIVTGVIAVDRESAVEEAPDHRTAVPIAAEAEDYALATNVLFIAGGVIGLAGVVLGLVDIATLGESEDRARLTIGPGSLAFSTRFE
jgi:tetratricopeptide (TPR) repeat protein